MTQVIDYVLVYLPMGITKSGSSNIRKITKVGKVSLAVTLPKDLVQKLGWKEKQKVVIKRIHGGVQVKDWKPKKK